jgi:hypothetical protein
MDALLPVTAEELKDIIVSAPSCRCSPAAATFHQHPACRTVPPPFAASHCSWHAPDE